MSISLLRVESDDRLSAAVVDIYLDAFPDDERRDVDDIKRLLREESRYTFYNILDSGGAEIGLLTCWDFDEVVYVEHFALSPTVRSQGYGGMVLEMLANRCSKPLLLEVEPAGSTPEALRRINFYRRHGFEVIDGYRYTQPPYSPHLRPVELKLMSTKTLDNVDDIVKRDLYGAVYRYQPPV